LRVQRIGGWESSKKRRKEKREQKGMMSYKLILTLLLLQHTVHDRILCQAVSAKVDQKVSSLPCKRASWKQRGGSSERAEGELRESKAAVISQQRITSKPKS